MSNVNANFENVFSYHYFFWFTQTFPLLFVHIVQDIDFISFMSKVVFESSSLSALRLAIRIFLYYNKGY